MKNVDAGDNIDSQGLRGSIDNSGEEVRVSQGVSCLKKVER